MTVKLKRAAKNTFTSLPVGSCFKIHNQAVQLVLTIEEPSIHETHARSADYFFIPAIHSA
jgi:hypothetical protein